MLVNDFLSFDSFYNEDMRIFKNMCLRLKHQKVALNYKTLGINDLKLKLLKIN